MSRTLRIAGVSAWCCWLASIIVALAAGDGVMSVSVSYGCNGEPEPNNGNRPSPRPRPGPKPEEPEPPSGNGGSRSAPRPSEDPAGGDPNRTGGRPAPRPSGNEDPSEGREFYSGVVKIRNGVVVDAKTGRPLGGFTVPPQFRPEIIYGALPGASDDPDIGLETPQFVQQILSGSTSNSSSTSTSSNSPPADPAAAAYLSNAVVRIQPDGDVIDVFSGAKIGYVPLKNPNSRDPPTRRRPKILPVSFRRRRLREPAISLPTNWLEQDLSAVDRESCMSQGKEQRPKMLRSMFYSRGRDGTRRRVGKSTLAMILRIREPFSCRRSKCSPNRASRTKFGILRAPPRIGDRLRNKPESSSPCIPSRKNRRSKSLER